MFFCWPGVRSARGGQGEVSGWVCGWSVAAWIGAGEACNPRVLASEGAVAPWAAVRTMGPSSETGRRGCVRGRALGKRLALSGTAARVAEDRERSEPAVAGTSVGRRWRRGAPRWPPGRSPAPDSARVRGRSVGRFRRLHRGWCASARRRYSGSRGRAVRVSGAWASARTAAVVEEAAPFGALASRPVRANGAAPASNP